MVTHSSILAWKTPWTEESDRHRTWGHKQSDTTEWLTLHIFKIFILFVSVLLLFYSFLYIGLLFL